MPRYPKTSYGFPNRAPAKRHSQSRIFRPTLGLHSGDVPQDLAPGFTPEAQNFVADEGYIAPRSGLSQFGGYSFAQPVLGGKELHDKEGVIHAFASSASTLLFYPSSNASWSELSYLKGSIVPSDDLPSGQSTDYWRSANIYDATLDEYIAVTSNGTNWAKWFVVQDSTTTYSDFTWTAPLDEIKAAKDIAAINDRLVLFHSVTSQGTTHPTRVSWSARGAPRDWTANSGAGFEPLVGMRGAGTAMVRFKDVLILFSDQEVWVAQPTLDDYAFRFDRITDALGCPYPRTAIATPLGVFFLGSDFEVYVTDGRQVQPASLVDGQSRIREYLSADIVEATRAWGVFNRKERRYELYYTNRDSTDGYPTKALYYHTETQSWFPQKFSHELSYGFDLRDPGYLLTWDEITDTFDSTSTAWNQFGQGEDRSDPAVFGSGGTSYRLRSEQTSDDGTLIDARWRSHGLNQSDQMRRASLKELWMDYKVTSASSVTVYLSDDLGQTWDSGRLVSMTSTERNAFVPAWINAQSPMFEVRVENGSVPRIGRFQSVLVDGGRF